MARVPVAESVGRVRLLPRVRLLRLPAARGAPISAHVRSAVGVVVKPRDRQIHVDVGLLAAGAPRRAAVLLHDYGLPARLDGVWILHQDALAAAGAARVGAAAAVVVPEQRGQRIRRGARHPKLLALCGRAAVSGRVSRLVPRRRNVEALVPRRESGRVAALAVAVPVVSGVYGAVPRRHGAEGRSVAPAVEFSRASALHKDRACVACLTHRPRGMTT